MPGEIDSGNAGRAPSLDHQRWPAESGQIIKSADGVLRRLTNDTVAVAPMVRLFQTAIDRVGGNDITRTRLRRDLNPPQAYRPRTLNNS